MPRKKRNDNIPVLIVPKHATLKQLYKIFKANFTAADLQKYTDLDESMVPADQVLSDLEAIHIQESRKRKKK